jgi:hypothetical protein
MYVAGLRQPYFVLGLSRGGGALGTDSDLFLACLTHEQTEVFVYTLTHTCEVDNYAVVKSQVDMTRCIRAAICTRAEW